MSEIGRLVAAGRTSDVFEFGQGSVVKVFRPYVPLHWAAKEARFTSAVREVGAPAPAVRGLVEIEGRDAIVFERVQGPSMWESIVNSRRDALPLAYELAAVHRSILSAGLPCEVTGLVVRMHSKIATVEQLTSAERREARRALDSLPKGAALLHGDLHPGNVLMGPGGPVVIDWFDAAIGHPMADVVRSSLLLRPFGATEARPHLPGADSKLLRELHDAYVEAMSDVLNAPPEQLRLLEALVAASRLAEDAEACKSPLLELWRDRERHGGSPLLAVKSSSDVNQRPQ